MTSISSATPKPWVHILLRRGKGSSPLLGTGPGAGSARTLPRVLLHRRADGALCSLHVVNSPR